MQFDANREAVTLPCCGRFWSFGNFDALLAVKRFRFLKCLKGSSDSKLVTLPKDGSSSEVFVFSCSCSSIFQRFLQMLELD